MATLPEDDTFPAGIYRIETTDPVLGGPPNEATGAGLTNVPAMQLAKRTRWLKTRVDALVAAVVAASTAAAGIVKLNTSTTSDSQAEAATPSAVKAAMDNANTRALAARSITAGGLATGGGDLTANRSITVPVATQAEAEAGADNSKAMTPLRVAQALLTRSLASINPHGWQRLPSGLIIQWGVTQFVEPVGATAVSATFPLTFPTTCFAVVTGNRGGNTTSQIALNWSNSGMWAKIDEWSQTENYGALTYMAVGY